MAFKLPGEACLRPEPACRCCSGSLTMAGGGDRVGCAGRAAQAPLGISVTARAALPCPGTLRAALSPLPPSFLPSSLPSSLPALRAHRQLCSRRSPLLHKCGCSSLLFTVPGSSGLSPGSRPGPAVLRSLSPSIAVCRGPEPPSRGPERPASPRSWCGPGRRCPRCTCFASLSYSQVSAWLGSAWLGLAGAWPLPPPVYSQFQEVRGCARSCWMPLWLCSPRVWDLLLKSRGERVCCGFVIGAGVLPLPSPASAVSSLQSTASVSFVPRDGNM